MRHPAWLGNAHLRRYRLVNENLSMKYGKLSTSALFREASEFSKTLQASVNTPGYQPDVDFYDPPYYQSYHPLGCRTSINQSEHEWTVSYYWITFRHLRGATPSEAGEEYLHWSYIVVYLHNPLTRITIFLARNADVYMDGMTTWG